MNEVAILGEILIYFSVLFVGLSGKKGPKRQAELGSGPASIRKTGTGEADTEDCGMLCD